MRKSNQAATNAAPARRLSKSTVVTIWIYIFLAIGAFYLTGTLGCNQDTTTPPPPPITTGDDDVAEQVTLTAIGASATDFYVYEIRESGSDLVKDCISAIECEVETEIGNYRIETIDHGDVIHYTMETKVKADTELLLKWGIAPNGIYMDLNENPIEVSTYRNSSGETEISMGAIYGTVEQYSIQDTTPSGNMLSGHISTDRQLITWEIHDENGIELDHNVLTFLDE